MCSFFINFLYAQNAVTNKPIQELESNSSEIPFRINEISTALQMLKDKRDKKNDDLIRLEPIVSNINSKVSKIVYPKEEIDKMIINLEKETKDDNILMNFNDLLEKFNGPIDNASNIIFSIRDQGSLAEVIRNSVSMLSNREAYRMVTAFDPKAQQYKLRRASWDAYKGKLRTDFTKEIFDSNVKGLLTAINEPYDRLKKEIGDLDNQISSLLKERASLQAQWNDKQKNFDKTIFQWGFPVFILFILALYLIPLVIYRHPKETEHASLTLDLFKLVYGSGLTTEIITVFLLTSTILVLGITDKLNPDILGTLIGGISGYVLGRSFKPFTERQQGSQQ
jgi:predicted  nucleic acid-binding Zn-ribbon protein